MSSSDPIGHQKYYVTLTCEIEGDIYEGDPPDLYDLADHEWIAMQADIERLHPGIDFDTVQLTVKPILK